MADLNTFWLSSNYIWFEIFSKAWFRICWSCRLYLSNCLLLDIGFTKLQVVFVKLSAAQNKISQSLRSYFWNSPDVPCYRKIRKLKVYFDTSSLTMVGVLSSKYQHVARGAIILLQKPWCGCRRQDFFAGCSESSFKLVFSALLLRIKIFLKFLKASFTWDFFSSSRQTIFSDPCCLFQLPLLSSPNCHYCPASTAFTVQPQLSLVSSPNCHYCPSQTIITVQVQLSLLSSPNCHYCVQSQPSLLSSPNYHYCPAPTIITVQPQLSLLFSRKYLPYLQ